jgi:hypothetical protein
MNEKPKKRQQETPNAIVEIPINDGEYYCYAQIRKEGYLFFDNKSDQPLKNLKILETAPVLFIICVYGDIVTKGTWQKVGKLPQRPELLQLPMKYMKDALSGEFSLYDPNTGNVTPCTRKEAQGKEMCIVWDYGSVHHRIRDYYAGKKAVWDENEGWTTYFKREW